MEPGRVVILNGSSSAGKTTIAYGFAERRAEAGEFWLVLGVDDWLAKLSRPFVEIDVPDPRWPKVTFGPHGDQGIHMERVAEGVTVTHLGPLARRVLARYRDTVANAARAGFDVLVDEVVTDQEIWDAWQRDLDGLDVTWVAVRCDNPAEREAARADRAPGIARGSAMTVHTFGPHDHEIDTTELDPAAAVDALEAIIAC